MEPYRIIFTVMCLVHFVNCEVNIEENLINTNQDSDPTSLKFQEIKKKFFNVLSNYSGPTNVNSIEDLVQLFDSKNSEQIGKLFVEGFMIGMSHKDPDRLFNQFWNELHMNVSPEMSKKLSGLLASAGNMDMDTILKVLPDFMANNFDTNQIVSLVQTAISKYGLDVQSLIKPFMGGADANMQDMLKLFGNVDVSSVSKIISEGLPKPTKKSPKASQNLATLKLFKPFFANLLRQNDINLDIDAIFDVLEPFLDNGQELFNSIFPQIMSMMNGEMDSTTMMLKMLPLLTQFGSNNKEREQEALDRHANRKEHMPQSKREKSAREKTIDENRNKFKPAGLDLGTIASLVQGMSGGGKDFNAMNLIGLASQFMGGSKKSNKDGKKERKRKPGKEDIKKDSLDLSSLIEVAAKLAGEEGDSSDLLMRAAGHLLDQKIEEKQKKTNPKPQKTEPTKKEEQKNEQESIPKKYLVDMLEPILLSIQNDQQCKEKIKLFAEFSKASLAKKSMGTTELKNLILPFISKYMPKESALVDLIKTFTKAKWIKYSKGMNNQEFRTKAINGGVNYATDLLKTISQKDARKKLYLMVMPNIDEMLKSVGMTGLTIENFPARIGPMLGLMTRNWDLPFNPVTLLVPLKNQLLAIQDWFASSLSKIEDMPKDEVKILAEASLTEILRGLGDFGAAVDKPDCLPRYMCLLKDRPAPRKYAARFAALVWSISEALEGKDILDTVKIAQAMLTREDCQAAFPGDCPTKSQPKPSIKAKHVHSDL